MPTAAILDIAPLSLDGMEPDTHKARAADIDAVYGQIRTVARDAEYLLKHGKTPIFFYRPPLSHETVGEIAVAVRWADLPQNLNWRLMNPHTPRRSLPWGDIYDWLRNVVMPLPLIRRAI